MEQNLKNQPINPNNNFNINQNIIPNMNPNINQNANPLMDVNTKIVLNQNINININQNAKKETNKQKNNYQNIFNNVMENINKININTDKNIKNEKKVPQNFLSKSKQVTEERYNQRVFSPPSNFVRILNNDMKYQRHIKVGALSLLFQVNNHFYILNIEKTDSNSIYFYCTPNHDEALLYEYSKDIPFEDISTLSKNFKICDNIDQIYETIKNTFKEHPKKSRPRIDLIENNNTIILFFITPLISGDYEDVNIILNKKERDVNTQFNILKKEYENLRNRHEKLKIESNKINNNYEKIAEIVTSNKTDESKLELIKKIIKG